MEIQIFVEIKISMQAVEHFATIEHLRSFRAKELKGFFKIFFF